MTTVHGATHRVSEFGGNGVREFGGLPAESCVLGDDAYRYEIVRFAPGERRTFDSLATGAAWLLDGGPVRAEHRAGTASVDAGGALLFEGAGLTLTAGDHPASILLAGTGNDADRPPSIAAVRQGDLHRVEKPWGEELWINGRHPTYAFKRIVLRAGHRTSLQYHEFKRETNLLLAGSARLHFNAVAGGHGGPYESAPIEAVSVVDVTPGILHRIEAVTDVTLFEVSTPHLDDVIRVSDDSNRADGLISSEHPGGAHAS